MEPLTIIVDPAAWTAKDYPDLEKVLKGIHHTLLPQTLLGSELQFMRLYKKVHARRCMCCVRKVPSGMKLKLPSNRSVTLCVLCMQHIIRLSPAEVTELDAAVHKATSTGKQIAVRMAVMQDVLHQADIGNRICCFLVR